MTPRCDADRRGTWSFLGSGTSLSPDAWALSSQGPPSPCTPDPPTTSRALDTREHSHKPQRLERAASLGHAAPLHRKSRPTLVAGRGAQSRLLTEPGGGGGGEAALSLKTAQGKLRVLTKETALVAVPVQRWVQEGGGGGREEGASRAHFFLLPRHPPWARPHSRRPYKPTVKT